MVNDAKESLANCKMRKVLVGSKPILCLFAKRPIEIGEELRYNYGVADLPWRKLKVYTCTFLKDIIRRGNKWLKTIIVRVKVD